MSSIQQKRNTGNKLMGCIFCSEIDWTIVDPFDHSVLKCEQDVEDDEEGVMWMLNISDGQFSTPGNTCDF